MAFLGNFMNALSAGWAAFREPMLNADPLSVRGGAAFDLGEWDRWESRCARYRLYNGLYQNNAYRDAIHPWSPLYKAAHGTTKHIRHLYNPAYRLGEFFAGHLMGGALDRDAGDGESVPSALPILTENEALRPAIAQLWKHSSWQINKEVFTRWGAVLAEAGLKPAADPDKGRMRLEVVHPGHIKWVAKDEHGSIKGYILQKYVYDPRDGDIKDASPDADPRSSLRRVRYTEKCYRDGDLVVFETYLDGKLYPWNGVADTWTKPYGFVPLVIAGHEAIGMEWAQNCFHAGLSRFREVDDQASCLGDQNRRLLKAPMLITGATGPAQLKQNGVDRAARTVQQNAADPEPERTEQGFLYSSSVDTKAFPLTAPMDVAGMIEHVRSMLSDIEMNYPELLADTGNLGGNVTAEAIRNARQRASAKVQARRVGYDDALVRAQQMAIAIGGFEKYDGYQGFGLDSYAAGKLDHSIAHRPVFDVNPMDKLEEDAALYKNAIAALTAGIPLPLFLERNGWSEADLAELKKAQALAPQPTTTINLGQTGQSPHDAGEGI